MANVKITDLATLTSPETTDVLPIVNDNVTKKVSVGEIVGKISGDVSVATNGASSITAGAIIDADVNAAAAIAGTKIDPDFGSQTVETTGVINAGSGTEDAPAITVGTTDNGLYSPGIDQVALSTNGTQRLLIKADGDINIDSGGVLVESSVGNNITLSTLVGNSNDSTLNFKKARGGSSPAQIVANDDLGAIQWNGYDGSSYNEAAKITCKSTANTGDFDASLIYNSNEHVFQNGGSESARITSDGKLGLGTDDPDTLLHLSSATGSATPTPTELRIATKTTASDWSATDPWGRISFYSNDVSSGGPKIQAAIDAISNGTTGASSELDFKTASNVDATLNSVMRLTYDGNVGIGTTSPSDLFHVMESSASAAAAAGSSVATFERAGNASITISTADTGEAVLFFGDTASSTVGRVQYDHSDNSLGFWANSFERARIGSDGTFRVKGAGTAGVSDAFAVNGSAPANSAQIDSSGRLLVGTSSELSVASITAGIELHSTATNNGASLSLARFNNDTTGPQINLAKSRNSTIAAGTIVQNDDDLGLISFGGDDGSNLNSVAARIQAFVDGNPAYAATALVSGQTYRIVTVGTTDFTLIGASANTVGTVFTATGPGTGTGTAILNAGNMPGRLVFSTNPGSPATGPTEQMRIGSDGEVTISSGFVTLNGNKLGGISVTIADDAFAAITPPREGAGFVAVTEGGDEVFPDSGCFGFVYADWGGSPVVNDISVGSKFETNTGGPPTGTTGSDNHATLFTGGTSGTIYLENRLGSTGVFFITFT